MLVVSQPLSARNAERARFEVKQPTEASLVRDASEMNVDALLLPHMRHPRMEARGAPIRGIETSPMRPGPKS